MGNPLVVLALSLSVDWHVRFYIAVLSIMLFFLEFVSGDISLTGFYL